jgi:two-component system, NtrC family, nitrogen regulation response regulator GlnG
MTKPRILVADDEESLRVVIRNSLKQKGYEVDCAENGREAAKMAGQGPYDVILADIRMPEMDGFKLLERIQSGENPPPVIMITAQDTMKNAIEAMKKGAFDYLTKPFDIDELDILVQKALKERALETEVVQLRQEVKELQTGPNLIVGESRPIREIYKMIGKLASRDVTVLIQGESGTGKELIARSIHYESDRASQPFVAVNVAAIPKELLESELFGHVRGAFTGANDDRVGYFEKAGRGTIFLDEIGELPLNLQAKILRVLQEKEIQRVGRSDPIPVTARVIAATNQNLAKMVKEKKFREDLFYRLNVVPLEIPPLRVRRDDIPLLTNYFVKKFCEELASPPKQIAPEVAKVLRQYAWPGNVRELENVIKRAIVLSPGPTIGPEVVQPFLGDSLDSVDMDEIALEDIVRKKLASFLSKWDGYEVEDLYDAVMKRVEKPLLELVLDRTRGNQIRAAKMLGINRNTLHKKIKELKVVSK